MFGEIGDFFTVFIDLGVSKRTFFHALFVPVNATVSEPVILADKI